MKQSIVVAFLPLVGMAFAHPKGHKSCTESTITITKTGEPPADPTCFICSDNFDDCGNTFGPGCWDSCKTPEVPSYTTPYCSVTTTTAEPNCFICSDNFDDCGNTFGPGCWDSCKTPEVPSYTTPYCSAATPTDSYTTPATPTDDYPGSCTLTICASATNECGQGYGYCYNACDHYPTPTSTPPCESSSAPTPTETCTLTVCVDGVTPCGQGFGGCFPACDGIPTDLITTPYCSLTETETGYEPPATTYYR
jgi:hypothetical protein